MAFGHRLYIRDICFFKGVECPEPVEGHGFVYILQCSDGSYYVGSSENVVQRIATHNAGRGPLWTRERLPVVLVYVEDHESFAIARRREEQIKGWSRIKKERLIRGEWKKQMASSSSPV